MRRRIVSITLLLFLVAPVFGLYTWLQLEKIMVKQEIKRKLISEIAQEDLLILKLTKEEAKKLVRWENSYEFEYGGQMYDVVKSQMYGNTVVFWCWWDHEETLINTKIAELTRNVLNSDTERKKNEENILRFFKSLFCQETPQWKSVGFKLICTNSLVETNKYQSIYFTPPSPPPQG